VRFVPGCQEPTVLAATARFFADAGLGELPLVKIQDLLRRVLGLEDECRSVALRSGFRYAAIQEGKEVGSAGSAVLHAAASIAKTAHTTHPIARGMRAMIALACSTTCDILGWKFDA